MSGVKKDEELVFHYSRESRLASASDSVRGLNEGGPRKKPNLFRTLTANRSLAFLFLAIIMLSLTAIVTSILVPSPEEAEYGGNRLSLSAFRFEETVYVAVRKTAKTNAAYVGPARLHVRASGGDGFDLSADVLFSGAKTQEFKYRIEAQGDQVEVVLEIGDKRLLLRAKPR